MKVLITIIMRRQIWDFNKWLLNIGQWLNTMLLNTGSTVYISYLSTGVQAL